MIRESQRDLSYTWPLFDDGASHCIHTFGTIHDTETTLSILSPTSMLCGIIPKLIINMFSFSLDI